MNKKYFTLYYKRLLIAAVSIVLICTCPLWCGDNTKSVIDAIMIIASAFIVGDTASKHKDLRRNDE